MNPARLGSHEALEDDDQLMRAIIAAGVLNNAPKGEPFCRNGFLHLDGRLIASSSRTARTNAIGSSRPSLLEGWLRLSALRLASTAFTLRWVRPCQSVDQLARGAALTSGLEGLKTTVLFEVEGAAHYLPAYAGSLDIVTRAALATAARMADALQRITDRSQQALQKRAGADWVTVDPALVESDDVGIAPPEAA